MMIFADTMEDTNIMHTTNTKQQRTKPTTLHNLSKSKKKTSAFGNPLRNLTNTPSKQASIIIKTPKTQTVTRTKTPKPTITEIKSIPKSITKSISSTKETSAFTPTILRPRSVLKQTTTTATALTPNIHVPELDILLSNNDFQSWLDHHVYSLSPARPISESDMLMNQSKSEQVQDNRSRPSNPVAKILLMKDAKDKKTRQMNRKKNKANKKKERAEVIDIFTTVVAKEKEIEITAPIVENVENINKVKQIEHVEQNEHVEEIKPTKKIEHDDETWSSGTLYGWVQHFDLQYKVPYYYNVLSGESVWKKPSGIQVSTLDDAPPSPIKPLFATLFSENGLAETIHPFSEHEWNQNNAETMEGNTSILQNNTTILMNQELHQQTYPT